MKLHTIFCRLFGKLPEETSEGMKLIKKTFWRAFSVFKSIGKFTTEELTNIPEITDESFFMAFSVHKPVSKILTDRL
jgi:hypothetical protein